MEVVDLVVKEKKKVYFCPKCKSPHTIRHGFNVTKKGRWARRKCQECGTTFYENNQGEGQSK